MSVRADSDPDSNDVSIEVLQQRYQTLHTRKIQAETNLANAIQQLDRLKQQAREKYGTDDVAKLREQLDTMRTENDQKRRSYQAQLDGIELDLADIEQKFAAAQDHHEEQL
jgi:hypothetical protein